jgi:hypothetical protein
MTKLGFYPRATRARLLSWCQHDHPDICTAETIVRPAGKSERIWLLLLNEHLRHWPCRIAGACCAILELDIYVLHLPRLVQIEESYELAKSLEGRDDAESQRLLEKVSSLASDIWSRPLLVEENFGRPRRPLAQAMSQHLSKGGFTNAEVAEFMGTNRGTVTKQLKTKDMRSLNPCAPNE